MEGGAVGGGSSGAKRKAPQCPEGMLYDDFDPLPLQQKAALPVLEFETFDAALDEFYSKVCSHFVVLFCFVLCCGGGVLVLVRDA